MNPRIVSLTGAPHPQARIDSLFPETGIVVFAWLDADGNPVDSGGSIARFAPVAPLPPAEEGEPPTLPDVSDEVLSDAIANPPPEPPAPRRQETRVILDRLTTGERAALFGSTNTDVRTLVAKALATGAIRDDDPDFPAAVAGLDALGIVASSRWETLLTP